MSYFTNKVLIKGNNLVKSKTNPKSNNPPKKNKKVAKLLTKNPIVYRLSGLAGTAQLMAHIRKKIRKKREVKTNKIFIPISNIIFR